MGVVTVVWIKRGRKQVERQKGSKERWWLITFIINAFELAQSAVPVQ